MENEESKQNKQFLSHRNSDDLSVFSVTTENRSIDISNMTEYMTPIFIDPIQKECILKEIFH